MFTAYVVVNLLAIAATTFSGIAALVHFKPIIPGMLKSGVPESWLTFPIGTLKTADTDIPTASRVSQLSLGKLLPAVGETPCELP